MIRINAVFVKVFEVFDMQVVRLIRSDCLPLFDSTLNLFYISKILKRVSDQYQEACLVTFAQPSDFISLE